MIKLYCVYGKSSWKKAISISFFIHLISFFVLGYLISYIPKTSIDDLHEEIFFVSEDSMNSQSPEIYTDESPEISFSSISDGTTDSIRRSNDNTQIKNHSNSSDSHTSIGNSGSRSDDQFYAANSNGLGNSTISSGNTAEGSVQDIPGTGFSAGNAEVGNASGLDSEERTDFENDIASAINGFVARVEAHKNYPYMAQRRNVEGTSVIHVVLNESGYISHLSVVSSAGDILDKAAMDAVREACPYMHGLKRDLSMDIPIHFYQE